MELKVLAIFAVIVAVAQSIPMPFRLEVPADEIIQIAPYRDDIDGKDYRLPNNTIPLHYDVWLSTDIHRGETAFTGNVKIRIRAVENTAQITLHYRQITIENIVLRNNLNNVIQDNVTFSFVEDLEFLQVNPTSSLVAGLEYVLEITYHGLLRDDNMGFYRSSYKNPQGQTVWLATTQFEQTDARHAFPCYDEPQIRTTFSIQIRHDASYSAISNMPVATASLEAGTNYILSTFQNTLPVQTYLIAFVVSDFKNVENGTQKVYAKAQSIYDGEGAFGLDVGVKLLNKFVEHLGVNYALPKMDQVAVPDFDAGAMENWGLVTYREEYLLYNDTTATTRQRENIITIISHEYAVSSIICVWRTTKLT